MTLRAGDNTNAYDEDLESAAHQNMHNCSGGQIGLCGFLTDFNSLDDTNSRHIAGGVAVLGLIFAGWADLIFLSSDSKSSFYLLYISQVKMMVLVLRTCEVLV